MTGGINTAAKPILICIDVEAFEFRTDVITEIGVSTLQTSVDNQNWLSDQGKSLREGIKSRHLRISERKHLVNRRYVQGCPDNFDFGKSEWISERGIPKIMKRIFQQSCVNGPNSITKPVLVGHSIKSDIDFLRTKGFDMQLFISDCIDTQNLYRASRHGGQSPGLGKALVECGIQATHLHNAGNDAYYTMRLLLELGDKRAQSPEEIAARAAALEEEVLKQKIMAEFRVRMRYEVWSGEEDAITDEKHGGQAPVPHPDGKEVQLTLDY